MKRTTRMAASAGAVLFALGYAEAAQATLPDDHAQAVLRVRQRVQAMKEESLPVIPDIPAPGRSAGAPKWLAGAIPAAYAPGPAPGEAGRAIPVQAQEGAAEQQAARADVALDQDRVPVAL